MKHDKMEARDILDLLADMVAERLATRQKLEAIATRLREAKATTKAKDDPPRVPSRSRKHKKWSPEEDQTLVNLWRAGRSVRAIARALHRTPKTVVVHAVHLRASGWADLTPKRMPTNGNRSTGGGMQP